MDETAKSAAAAGLARPLLAAVRRLLRPLVRLLIDHSIPYTAVAELIRWIYVDVAVREFPLPDKPQTDSRISLLTGVHRREVRRLRRRSQARFETPRSATLGTQIVARWITEAEFLDAGGAPLALPYVSDDPRRPSFEMLVRSVSRDIRPRVVLDEWLRLGVAELGEGEIVRLVTDAFVPSKGADELAYFFGRNLHDHIAAGAHNLMGGEPAFLERSVYYNNLAPASVAELDALAREQAMRSLKDVNNRALEMQRRDAGDPQARRRINFGVYFFSDDAAAAAEREGDDE